MTPNGIDLLKRQEGFRNTVYSDTRGFMTIGYGTNLSAGISEAQAQALLEVVLTENRKALEHYTWFTKLDVIRQDIIENMAYNMGIDKLLQFHFMICALDIGDNDKAAEEMLNSQWAKQVGARAIMLASIMSSNALFAQK